MVKNVPYVCNEIILDPANRKIEGWKAFLAKEGFVRKDTCSCENKLELWRYDTAGDFNVIGIVKDPPPEVDAIGDPNGPIGASLNYLSSLSPADETKNGDEFQVRPPTTPCRELNRVKVAIIDTGVDTVVDISDNALLQFGWKKAGTSGRCPMPHTFGYHIPEPPLEPEDNHGHGTSVNGVATGVPYYNAPRLNLPLEFLNIKITPDISGSGSLFDGLCGIYHAIKERANVINVSWGYMGNLDNEEIPLIDNCLSAAADSNIIVVAGMGNDTANLNGYAKFLPASRAEAHPNVISVGAVDNSGNRAVFSNWSTNQNEMTLTALGVDVISAYPKKLHNPPTGISMQSGTSFAAPFVTRTVAAIWSLDPARPIDQVISLIESTADNNGGGYLILNHQNAVAAVCNDLQ